MISGVSDLYKHRGRNIGDFIAKTPTRSNQIGIILLLKIYDQHFSDFKQICICFTKRPTGVVRI